MKKLFINIIFFLFVSFFCVFAQGELRWGADAEGNAPYIFQDPDNPTALKGFEVDIANNLAKRMGLKPVFVQNQWDGLIPGLGRKEYDIVLNGLEITEERKSEVLFSIPYYYTSEKLVVRADDRETKNLSDLKGKRVGALKNSLAEKILKAQGSFEVRTYEGEVNAFEDLKIGRLDAALVDFPIALYYASWNKELRVTGEPIGEVIYGVAMRLNDSLLLSNVNKALVDMIRSGELRLILDKWNLWNEVIALRLGDYSPSNVEPNEFNSFVRIHEKETNLMTRFERYVSFLPLFLKGALITLILTVFSMVFAVIFGLSLALSKIFGPKWISAIATSIIEVIRGTPLLIQLFMIFYALPTVGIKFSPFVAGILGLGLNYAAYEAENYRAGLFAVAKGQMEAAISLGMNRKQALRYIILPQSFKIILPPMTNDFISLLKDSSLVSVITMEELTKVYNQISSIYFDFLGTGIIVAIIYLLMGLPFIKIAKYVESRFGIKK